MRCSKNATISEGPDTADSAIDPFRTHLKNDFWPKILFLRWILLAFCSRLQYGLDPIFPAAFYGQFSFAAM